MLKKSTRRSFLKQASATASAAIAFPYIVPSSALGKDGAVAPSEPHHDGLDRHRRAGPRADGHLHGLPGSAGRRGVRRRREAPRRRRRRRQREVRQRGLRGLSTTSASCVARKDIDAVVVATPDHWHALASVAALDAGKDVYCEKPLANSIYESREIVDAVKRNNRVLQTGSMERSNPNCRYARELVRNGAIGKLQADHRQPAVHGRPPSAGQAT